VGAKALVSEKTLELNIASEVLTIVRQISGCNGAFWTGVKQLQELTNGIDELLANVPKGVHLALQFKAPRPLPKNGYLYHFTFNDKQHGNLVRLASSRPRAAALSLRLHRGTVVGGEQGCGTSYLAAAASSVAGFDRVFVMCLPHSNPSARPMAR